MPAFVGARLARSNTIMPDGFYQEVTFQNEVYDTDNFRQGSLIRLTIPAGLEGYYLVQAAMGMSGVALGVIAPAIRVNAVIVAHSTTELWTPTISQGVKRIVYLVEGNFVRFLPYHESGAARALNDSASHNWLSVTRLGS